jgi:hypothetical protein
MEQPIAGAWKHRGFQITYNNSIQKVYSKYSATLLYFSNK